MSDKISSSEQSTANEKLATRVGQTLEKSLADIDDVNLQRLKNARLHALHHASKPARQWLPLSIAASLAALLLIPILAQQLMQQSELEQDFDFVLQDVPSPETPLSAQEMDDLEMLMALEDTDV